MSKILFICPHLSTGGSPQVTLNKIEFLIKENHVQVVEYSFLSSLFVVQRNKILKLVRGENFHSLSGSHPEKMNRLIEIVEKFRPDIVSVEEFPEMFADVNEFAWFYEHLSEKSIKIIESTHDSSFRIENKIVLPDEFLFVSQHTKLKYSYLNIPTNVVEYPVEHKPQDKKSAREKLGLRHDLKHVIIVGLFTPRKNQAYAVQIAEMLLDSNIQFHFLGNQAENFTYYWKPIMEVLPSNCVIWGERDDVEVFVEAADLFLFPSKGDDNNKELNPIAIKEAAIYQTLPKLFYNLEVYLGKYDELYSYEYLTGDPKEDSKLVLNLTNGFASFDNEDEIIIVGTYPNLNERKILTKECISSLKSLRRKIMLVSHYKVPEDIQEMVDYYIFDAHNPLTFHSYYTQFFNYSSQYDAIININGLKDSNQSLTVLTNLYNGFKAAKSYGFKKAFYITYDVIVNPDDLSTIHHSLKCINDVTKAYVAFLPTPLGHGLQTTAMTFDIDCFLERFDDVRNAEDYNRICESISAHNFLEDYMYKVLVKKYPSGTYVGSYNEKGTFLVNSGLGVSSNSEYYSIIPIKDSEEDFMFYFYSYNLDNRKLQVTINNNQSYTTHLITIKENREFKTPIRYQSGSVEIKMEFIDGDNIYKVEKYVMNESNIQKYRNTGSFKWKKRPKIKLVHLQTTLELDKEIQSREQLRQVADHGWEYVLHQNKPYEGLPPKHNCVRPDCVSITLFDEEKVQQIGTALTPSHYGCYDSFKTGILSEFSDDLDFIIVCEGDCKLLLSVNDFVYKVEAACSVVNDQNIGYMSFGDTKTLEHGWLQSPVVQDLPNTDVFITNHIIGLQCIMFPKKVKSWLFENLRVSPWDGADMFFNMIFTNSPYKMGIVNERYTSQFDGYSLIDKQQKHFL
jgi:hypothetical protein